MADRSLISSEHDETLMLAEGREPAPEESDVPAPRAHTATARRYTRIARWVALSDVAALEAAMIASLLIRSGFQSLPSDLVLALVILPPVWVGLFAALQLYSFARLSPVEEFRRLAEATTLAVASTIAMALLLDRRVQGLSGGWLALTLGLALIAVFSGRALWHKEMGRLRANGLLSYRTVIVGTNEEAARIAEVLKPKASGYVPVGLVQADRTTAQWLRWNGLPVLGTVDRLGRIVEEQEIESVFVASSAVDSASMKLLMKQVRRTDVQVKVSANMTEILSSRLTVQPVGTLLALSLRPVRLSGPQAVLKRTFDLVVGLLAGVLSSPIWAASALLVKTTSRGPVLFRQRRIGKDGRPFTIYKFRTMVRDAEDRLADLKSKNEADGPLFKMRNDPRVTRIGRALRKYSLDELPQLINVVKGQMSLVGPRPPLPEEVALYEDWHMDRLEVRPGITGLWQVRGRSELSFDDYVRLDLFYIENWSVAFDLFIMAKTIPAVLLRRGAF